MRAIVAGLLVRQGEHQNTATDDHRGGCVLIKSRNPLASRGSAHSARSSLFSCCSLQFSATSVRTLFSYAACNSCGQTISFLPPTYRSARVISTDTLRMSLVLEVSRREQERE